jgi:hypothetical protein
MLAGMTGTQIGIFASVFGVGLGAASLIGYVRWRHWKQQLRLARVFETFSIENGVLSAEVIAVPRTTIEMYGFLTPVRELADAVRGARGQTG